MPLIDVTLVEGREAGRIRTLIHRLHAAAVETLEVPPETLRILVHELPAAHWAAGDVTVAERERG
jgi:4-oxalocrotonate tautomerase